MQSFGRQCFKYHSRIIKDSLNENHWTFKKPFWHKFPEPSIFGDPICKNPQKMPFFSHTKKIDTFLFQVAAGYTEVRENLAPICFNSHYSNSQKIPFFLHTQNVCPLLFHITANSNQFPVNFAPNCFNSHYHYSSKAHLRSFQKRARKRLLKTLKPKLDQAKFQSALSQLPPRFTPEELCNLITLQNDPLVCLELFQWATQQPRFRHDVSTYHVTIKKLGAAKMYEEMDAIVNQVMAVPMIGSEVLYNAIIYYLTEARKLSRAVNVFKLMKSGRNLGVRPSIKTYNILFAAFLSRGSNTYINHLYMETIRSLFRQMVNDGVEPDIFSLNAMIKGYVLSLHVNDALRIFHQMGVVYECQPNSFTYDYLIHGLCAQGRTKNASELYHEMKAKGFIPSSKSYNSLVNALALGGEVDKAVNFLWEMTEKKRSADFITYMTVLDEICRGGRVKEAVSLLHELRDKDLVDGHAYRKLLYVLEDDYGSSGSRVDSGWQTMAEEKP